MSRVEEGEVELEGGSEKGVRMSDFGGEGRELWKGKRWEFTSTSNWFCSPQFPLLSTVRFSFFLFH